DVRLLSDDHGAPARVADHRAPTAPGVLIDGHLLPGWLRGDAVLELQFGRRGPMVVDALDYYGTWKLLDGLVDAVFHGVHREYALGNTPEQRFTGLWSDRVPVREPHVEEPSGHAVASPPSGPHMMSHSRNTSSLSRR